MLANLKSSYIFSPTDEQPPERPNKKRKISHKPLHATPNGYCPFPALLNGRERDQNLRFQGFQQFWEEIDNSIEDEACWSKNFIEDVAHFLAIDNAQSSLSLDRAKIKSALIVTGQEKASYRKLVNNLKDVLPTKTLVTEVDSAQSGNLKNALRALIKSAIVAAQGVDKYTDFLAARKKKMPLNYDLELLQEFVSQNDVERVVISVEDADICDTRGLSDLLSTLSYVEKRLADSEPLAAQQLLNSDDFLLSTVRQSIERGKQTMKDLLSSIHVFNSLLLYTHKDPPSGFEVYSLALSGKILSSSLFIESFDSFKKLDSTNLSTFLSETLFPPHQLLEKISTHKSTLTALLSTSNSIPLHPQPSPRNTTQRTVISQGRITLTSEPTTTKSSKSTTHNQDPYTSLLTTLTTTLHEYFTSTLNSPTSSPDHLLHEAYLILPPTSQTLTQSLHPRPRHAIQRALTSPADYLDCDCCSSTHSSSTTTHQAQISSHPTAVLWRLYGEAGANVNVADLWSAFEASMNSSAGQDDDDEGEDVGGDGDEREKATMAQFYTALAELKMLGFVKGKSGRGRGGGGEGIVEKRGWAGL
ncbi:MAG: hypothetical protein Q9227_003651 [Pyrenula ochraceoflavens]